MRKFNENHFRILRQFILENEDCYNVLVSPEILNEIEQFCFNRQNFNITTAERRQLAVDRIPEDILARFYAIKKYTGELNDLFENCIANINNYDDSTELSLMYDYLGLLYENDAIFTEENAINQYGYMLGNNEIWKLFEDENYPNYLMPVQNEN